MNLSDEGSRTWPYDDLLSEAERQLSSRASWSPKTDLFAGSFPQQRAFATDDAHPLQCVFCSRRAAKSYSFGLKAVRTAQSMDRVTIPILGLQRQSVKDAWWQPVIQDISERFHVPMEFNKTELTATLENGSTIHLLGMDADEKQKRKVLGQKFPLVGIDEAQDWATDLHLVVYSQLKPAVADYNGIICMMGTPGLVAAGLFFDVTTGKEAGWKIHEWTTYDNTTRDKPDGPTMADKWGKEIESLKAMKPGVEKTAWFRRNYLREWVIDEDALVYRFQDGRNTFLELPQFPRGEWTYGLGCDLGHTDASSFNVTAYHEHDPCLYVLKSYKQAGLDVTSVANEVRRLEKEFSFTHYVIDGANKQAVEEMRRRHGIPWEAADKIGKEDFIDLMNADFITQSIKLQAKETGPLQKEYRELVWDQRKLREKRKRVEHAACQNHCADGTLYIWRKSYPYLSERLPAQRPQAGSPQWHEERARKHQEEVELQLREHQAQAERRLAERREAENEWEFLT